MRKILITGGAGNIGGSLARRLAMQPNNHITIVDNFSTGDRVKLPARSNGNWELICADVNNKDDITSIMTTRGFDYVFHYAAVVGVKRTLSRPSCVLDDINGIKNVLNAAKNTSVKRVFYSSSSEVYGEPFEIPQREETTPLNSRLPYAIVKNVGEAFCRTYSQDFNQDYTIFRFFNTYGPLQSDDFVVSKFIKLALLGNEISIFGPGSQTRTFCYIDDNLDFTELVLNNGDLINETVNVGNNHEITVMDLAQTVLKVSGSRSTITHLPPLLEGDMSRRCPDISRMLSIINKPLIALEDGLGRTIAAYRNSLNAIT